MKGRFAILCTAALCMTAVCAAAVEPNETFEQAAVLSPGAMTTGLQSFNDGGLGITYPDTTLGFYSDATFSTLAARNNDHTFLGDGRGSVIPMRAVNRDGSVPLAISGFPDMDFDGLGDSSGQPHSQSGNVQLTLRIWDTGPTTVPFAEQVMDVTLSAGEVLSLPFADESWIGHIFTAIVDNTVDGGNDVDFWRFTGLTPGALFNARTSPATSPQGTILRLYDAATGSVLVEGIDAQEGCTFGLCGEVGESGEVVFGVTGYDDLDFVGAHGALGTYSLNLFYDGDTDLDGDVDGDDLANLLLGFGTVAGATRALGDMDRDGDVDREDLAIWQHNSGAGTPGGLTIDPQAMAGQSAGVPEPHTVIMLAAAMVVLVGCRARI